MNLYGASRHRKRQEEDNIMGAIGPLLIIGLVAFGPLAWRIWSDHRQENALAVRADVTAAVSRGLHGESLISVQVEPATPWAAGRVILSVPGGWDWLVHDVWDDVIAQVPDGYEVVVKPGHRPSAVEGMAHAA